VTGTAPISGSLTDVTVEGPLNIVGSLEAVGVSFTGAGGSGAGTVNLDGSLILSVNTNKLYNVTIDNVSIAATAGSSLIARAGGILTLGPNLTLKVDGDFSLGLPAIEGGRFVNNEGTLEEDGPGRFVVYGGLTNSGTIRVENGGTFVVATRGGLDTDGGTYIIGAHSSLKLARGGTGTALSATVVMEGVGASFLSAGLATITSQGSLTMENGATLSVAANFTIDGALHLAGSNFNSAHITIDAGGSLAGHGQVLGAVANKGTIDAAGGGLTISQDVSGTGQVMIENGSALAIDGDVSAGQTVTFESASGKLALGSAAGFAGTIAGFAAGDVIRLINTKATGVIYNAAQDTLTIKNNGALVATLQLAGDYTGDTFHLAADGKGGTNLTVTAPSSALHQFVQAIAASAPSDMASLIASAQANLHSSAAQMLAAVHG
jgi:hypothetical protein